MDHIFCTILNGTLKKDLKFYENRFLLYLFYYYVYFFLLLRIKIFVYLLVNLCLLIAIVLIENIFYLDVVW